MKQFCYLLFFTFVCTHCGGSGNSGNDTSYSSADVFPGTATLEVAPREIDTGERLLVRVNLADINDDGVIVKIRFPEALTYHRNSAFLRSGSDLVALDPDQNGIGAINADEDTTARFIVFFLSRVLFDFDNRGTLLFELQGIGLLEDGDISVDIDLNDRTVRDRVEFSFENPQFTPADSIDVLVFD